MLDIRPIENESDWEYWRNHDPHIPTGEMHRIVEHQRVFILRANETPIGILRYNLFWDQHPFLNLIWLEPDKRRRGYGRQVMAFWEDSMHRLGFGLVLLSTQANEEAQHFYRRLGYRDCGGFILDGSDDCLEILFMKRL